MEGDAGKTIASSQLRNKKHTTRSTSSSQEVLEEMRGKPVKSSNAKIMSFPTETRVIMRFPVMPVIHWAVGDTLESRVHEKISSGGDLLSILWRTALGEKDDAGLPVVELGNKTSYHGLVLPSSLISHPLARIHHALLPLGSHMKSPEVYFIWSDTWTPLSGSCRQKGPCFQSLPPGDLLRLSVMPPKHTLFQNFLQIYQNAEKKSVRLSRLCIKRILDSAQWGEIRSFRGRFGLE